MKLDTLEKDCTYHIYNRGINGGLVFKDDENKRYFLHLFKKHLGNKVSCFAYCLMDNHYHFILRIDHDEKEVSRSISNFLNAYAKAFNKRFNRTGSLFEKHFKRKKLDNETYLRNLIMYVNKNPVDYKKYQFSSYQEIVKGFSSIVNIEETISYFDDVENFIVSHDTNLRGVVEERDLLVGLDNTDSNSESDLQGFQNLAGQTTSMKDQFYQYIQDLQDTITQKLEEVDGKATFQQDFWERSEGGGGRTRVIENGNVFEKGGVNISAVHGALPLAMQQYFGVKDADFFACGLSLVLHPTNPMVPTVHANWRYFEMYDKEGTIVDQWFGGGQDLTPYYLFEEDGKHFHQICKIACDKHSPDFYAKYKKKCDEYFWNAHRNEARGLGGLFFDYCKKTDKMEMQDWYNFVTEVGDSFLEAYVPIVERRKELVYTNEQRDWQEIRRGRYVEFNLVHDKGTLFGLKTNGRIESILMSLPPHVQWVYDHHPEEGSKEDELLKVLANPVDWV